MLRVGDSRTGTSRAEGATAAGAVRSFHSQEATAGLRRMDREQEQHRGPGDGQPYGEGSHNR